MLIDLEELKKRYEAPTDPFPLGDAQFLALIAIAERLERIADTADSIDETLSELVDVYRCSTGIRE